jgi:hypothetical protein
VHEVTLADPTPWADELVRVAARLEAKTKQTRWTDRTDVLIERDFVVGAYAMRKLLRSGEAGHRQIPIRRFDPSVKRPPAPDDAAETYDIEHSRRETLSVADLCQQILHSSVFTFCCGETADLFDGIYISSDAEEKNVFLVLASDFIALCNDIGVEIV